MISKGGSYIKEHGKLTRVGGTEEPKAVDVASGGVSSSPKAEADGAAASADPGTKAKKGA